MPENSDASIAILPFFRASVEITGEERRRLARLSAPADMSLVLRENLHRVLAAGLLAHHMSGKLILVEGWKSNRIGRRFVAGSRVQALLLRLLRSQGLLPSGIPIERVERSRCTWQEVRAARALVDDNTRVIGVSGGACPSVRRARIYLREIFGETCDVWSAERALAHCGPRYTDAQAELVQALQPRPDERVLDGAREALNWGLRIVSQMTPQIRGLPFEAWLAVRLRGDRPSEAEQS